MSSFLTSRKIIKAEELRGPRVYSTDLLPSLFDPKSPDESVTIAARALKIKLLTKGIVTLNSTHLVSPMAVKLLDRHPDLFHGDAIIPAFRDDRENLADWILTTGDRAIGYDEKQLREHVARVEGLVTTAMPWSLGTTGATYKNMVLAGLKNPRSPVRKRLQGVGVTAGAIERIMVEIEKLDFSISLNLREYVDKQPREIKESLSPFTAACYHHVGTAVVRCETGTDLNPLSDFKAADLALASRGSEMLSDDKIFLEAFLGFALETISSSVIPAHVIDAIDFKTAHDLSAALRKQGFQSKYDSITAQYASTLEAKTSQEALQNLDEQEIASKARELAEAFQKEVLQELPDYELSLQEGAKEDLYRSGADIATEVVSTAVESIPVIGNVVSFAEGVSKVANALGDVAGALAVRDQKSAFEEAHRQRREKIEAAIAKLAAGEKKKSSLLDAVAALSDIHVLSIKRA